MGAAAANIDGAPRALLLDLDGTLYVGGSLIDGARATIDGLRAAGVALRFLTNSTTRSARELLDHLEALGLDVADRELVTPLRIAAGILRGKPGARCLLVVRDSVRGEFAGLAEDAGQPTHVVIGDIGAAWDYALMNRLFAHVMAGAAIVALHKGRFWETEQGLSLDIGAFVAGLEYATGRAADVVGKPSPSYFLEPLRELGVAPGDAIVVGDDLDSDVGGAASVGMRGVLVRTGKYREEYARRSAIAPWRTIDSVAELPELLGLA